jgi:hypothetical protein
MTNNSTTLVHYDSSAQPSPVFVYNRKLMSTFWESGLSENQPKLISGVSILFGKNASL